MAKAEKQKNESQQSSARQSVATNGKGISREPIEGIITNLEQANNISLSGINLFTNSTSAEKLGAYAYAQGNDVHFAPGKYSPYTEGGKQLLGHELAHVVQQKKGRVSPTAKLGKIAINNDTALEREADQMGTKASKAPVLPTSHLSTSSRTTGVQPVAQMFWNPFKKKKKNFDDKHELGYEALGSGTASNVFAAMHKTKGKVYGGYAKEDMGIGDMENDTTINLGIKTDEQRQLTENPRLIARQVASSKLDKKLGLNVLADERMGTHNGKAIGISGEVAGKSIMEKTENGDIYHDHDFSNPETQKGLSNLHVMDYLTGQMDRHGGNIFIDPSTGRVKGIDNDMAFEKTGFTNSANALVGLPQNIDKASAKKILKFKDKDMLAVLSGKGDQQLNEEEKKHALLRLQELKKHIRGERINKKGEAIAGANIIDKWDQNTYQQAVDTDKNVADKQFGKDYHSYVGRSVEARRKVATTGAGVLGDKTQLNTKNKTLTQKIQELRSRKRQQEMVDKIPTEGSNFEKLLFAQLAN